MWPSGLQLSVWNSVLHRRLLNDSVWPFTPPNNLLYRARAILRLRQIGHQYHSGSTHCQLCNEGTKKEQKRQKVKRQEKVNFLLCGGEGFGGEWYHAFSAAKKVFLSEIKVWVVKDWQLVICHHTFWHWPQSKAHCCSTSHTCLWVSECSKSTG